MIALLLIILFACIAAALGRALLDRLDLPVFAMWERLAYGGALGLGIAAYGVYALGLAGLLSFWPVTCWWLALAVAGWGGWRSYGRDFQFWRQRRRNTVILSPSKWNAENGLILTCGICLLVFGLIAVLACFRPPGPLEWDALSYHLADPKLFLLQHRIPILPTEHHSNFPFTLEMLFAVGLLYNGYALANLFHLLLAAFLVMGMIGFCSRVLRPVVGWLASVVFVTTPMVLWECSVAYIDVGLATYTTLAAFALVSALGKRKKEKGESAGAQFIAPDALTTPDAQPQPPLEQSNSFLLSPFSFSLLLLSGALTGFALGMKYLALVPFGLMAVMLLLARVPIRKAALFVGIALAIGSPWYVKNAVVMRNPVYPFVTKVFPQSRYWSLERAASYQSEQDKFGTKPLSPDVRSKLLNILQVPWHLLTRPNVKSSVLYCNPGEYNFTALFGGLYAALVFPLAFVRRISPAVRRLLWLGMGQVLAWFVLSQVGRYLIQVMPLFAIVGAYAACRFVFTESSGNVDNGGAKRLKHLKFAQLPGVLGIAAVFGQACYVLLSVCTLPMNASGDERRALTQLGQMPSSVSVPTLFANLAQPQAWDADLRRHFDAYDAEQWINQNTPPSAGIALVDETRGFYLDHLYVWANQQHSSYIPYETLQNGAELTTWFHEHGIEYALINLNQAAQNNGPTRDPDFPGGPNGVEINALLKWYVEGLTTGATGDRGHQLMGDAIKQGLWTPIFNEHGCVVMQMKSTSDTPNVAPQGMTPNVTPQSAASQGGNREPSAAP